MAEDISLKDKHWQATLALVSLGYSWWDHDSSDAASAARELVEYFEASWKEMLLQPKRESNALYISQLLEDADLLGEKVLIAINIIRELSALGEQVHSVAFDCKDASDNIMIHVRGDFCIECSNSGVCVSDKAEWRFFGQPNGREKHIASEAIKFIDRALAGRVLLRRMVRMD